MLVNFTLPRGVGEWKESKSKSQPADSEDRLDTMCWSGEEKVD